MDITIITIIIIIIAIITNITNIIMVIMVIFIILIVIIISKSPEPFLGPTPHSLSPIVTSSPSVSWRWTQM